VNQFLVVSDGNTFFGALNRAAKIFKDIKIIGNIGRYLLRKYKYFFRKRIDGYD